MDLSLFLRFATYIKEEKIQGVPTSVYLSHWDDSVLGIVGKEEDISEQVIDTTMEHLMECELCKEPSFP